MKKSWKELKLENLDLLYGTSYMEFKEAVENGADDDRRLFVNIYEQILRGLNSLPENMDGYVRVAMWRQIGLDKKTLNNIQARFCD